MNKAMHDLALRSALDTFLSEYPSDIPPGDVLDVIRDAGRNSAMDISDDILPWQPFENVRAEDLAGYISTDAECRMKQYREVAEALQEMILDKNAEDKLEWSNLSLACWVEHGAEGMPDFEGEE